jgi:hypothetical protein
MKFQIDLKSFGLRNPWIDFQTKRFDFDFVESGNEELLVEILE